MNIESEQAETDWFADNEELFEISERLIEKNRAAYVALANCNVSKKGERENVCRV